MTRFGVGWRIKSYIDYAPTAAEKALAGEDADKVFGVYRGESGGTPFVKAVFIRVGELPKGLMIIAR